MGFYKNMEKVDAAGDRGNFVRAGHYLVLISRLRSGESQSDGTDFAAIDMTVIHTFDDGDTPMYAPDDEKPKEWQEDPQGWHKPGEDISAVYSGKHKSSKPNFKAFIANAVGVSPDDIDSGLCAKIEEDELLGGLVVELRNRMISKRNGGPITKIWCTREVPPSEFINILAEDVIEKHWPDGKLLEMIEAEGADSE